MEVCEQNRPRESYLVIISDIQTQMHGCTDDSVDPSFIEDLHSMEVCDYLVIISDIQNLYILVAGLVDANPVCQSFLLQIDPVYSTESNTGRAACSSVHKTQRILLTPDSCSP